MPTLRPSHFAIALLVLSPSLSALSEPRPHSGAKAAGWDGTYKGEALDGSPQPGFFCPHADTYKHWVSRETADATLAPWAVTRTGNSITVPVTWGANKDGKWTFTDLGSFTVPVTAKAKASVEEAGGVFDKTFALAAPVTGSSGRVTTQVHIYGAFGSADFARGARGHVGHIHIAVPGSEADPDQALAAFEGCETFLIGKGVTYDRDRVVDYGDCNAGHDHCKNGATCVPRGDYFYECRP